MKELEILKHDALAILNKAQEICRNSDCDYCCIKQLCDNANTYERLMSLDIDAVEDILNAKDDD